MMKKAIRKTADMIQKNIISKKRLDMLDLTLKVKEGRQRSLADSTRLTTLPRNHSAHGMKPSVAPTEPVDGMVDSRETAYRVVNQAERKYPKYSYSELVPY